MKFRPKNYCVINNWHDVDLSISPAIKAISNEEVENSIKTGKMFKREELLCHTPSVESCIKLVT